MDLIEPDNKENCSSKRPTTRKKPSIPLLNNYLAEQITIEEIEPSYSNKVSVLEEDDEPIDPSYAMDYITDIMNLLYTLEKKYPIRSSYLIDSNGGTTRSWKVTAKHRTILIGWIIQLFYAKFHLSQDSMHM
jgi:hypothetical protein